MMKIYCTTEEGGVRPKLIDLEEGEGSEFSTMDVVNERPLLLLVSSISLLIFFYLSFLYVQRTKETVHVCRAKIETF